MVGPKVPLTDYLGVEGGRLRGIDQILTRASSDLGKQIRGLKVVDEETAMTRIQLRAQQSAIKAHLDQDWKDIAAATDAGQREAVVAASRTISKYENEMWTLAGVPQADLKAMADMEAKRAARSVRTMMDREQASLRPLAGSVYRAKAVANGFVDNAVNSALSRGLSVDQFASEIEKLISPTTPGGVSYAARRLARTEINNAYHAGSKRRYDESGMVDFIDWHKSSSHPEGDECDDLEANSPYDADKVPDKPHPQCLCYVTPGLPDQEEFLRNVLSDKYGRQKSFIEEVAPEAITAAALGTVAIRVAPYAFRYAKRRILKSSLQPGPKIALKALNSSASREEIADALSVARAAARKAQRDQLEEIVRRAAETGDDIRDIAQQVKPVGGQQVTPTSGGAKISAIGSLRDRVPTGKIAANNLTKKTVDNTVKAPRNLSAGVETPKASPYDLKIVQKYTQNSFEMNDHLRKGKSLASNVKLGPLESDMVVALDRTIGREGLAKSVKVRRVISGDAANEALDAAENGRIYSDKAFMSTQKANHGSIADMIDDYGQGDGNIVMFEMELPKGYKAFDVGDQLDDFPGFYDEGEIILPRGAKFQTSDLRKGADGEWRIKLTPVADDPPSIKEYKPRTVLDYTLPPDNHSPQMILEVMDLMPEKAFAKLNPRTIEFVRAAALRGDQYFNNYAPDYREAFAAAKRLQKAEIAKAAKEAAGPVAAKTPAKKAVAKTFLESPEPKTSLPDKPVRLKVSEVSEDMLAEQYPIEFKAASAKPLPEPNFPRPVPAKQADELGIKTDRAYYDKAAVWTAYDRSVKQSGPAAIKALRARYIADDVARQKNDIRRAAAANDPTIEKIDIDYADLSEEELIIERRLAREYKKAVLSIRDDYADAIPVNKKKFVKRQSDEILTDIYDGKRRIPTHDLQYKKHAREIKAMEEYTSAAYRQMNDHLRLGKEVSAEVQQYIDDMLELTTRNKLEMDTILTRGVDSATIQNAIKAIEGTDINDLMGQTLIDDAFISTDFGTVPMWGSYQFEILAPKGTMGMNVSAYNPSLESEFVMRPGTGFKVVGLRDKVFDRADYAADGLGLDPYDGDFYYRKTTIITVVVDQDDEISGIRSANRWG